MSGKQIRNPAPIYRPAAEKLPLQQGHLFNPFSPKHQPRRAEPALTHASGVRERFGTGEAGDAMPGHPMVQRGQEAGLGMMDLTELLPSKDDGDGDGVTGVKKLGHWDKEENIPVFCYTVARASQKYFL